MGRDSASPLNDAIVALQTAAVQPAGWPDALARITSLLDCSCSHFMTLDKRTGAIVGHMNYRVPEQFFREYPDYHHMNPRSASFRSRELIVHDYTFVSEEERRRNPFYRWIEQFEGGFFIAANGLGSEDVLAGGAFVRSDRKEYFSAAELELFSRLWPHLHSAVTASRTLAASAVHFEALSASLEAAAIPAVVLDEHGRIRTCNQTADILLRARDGVYRERNGLAFSRGEYASLFARALAEALSASATSGERGAGRVLWVERPSGTGALKLQILPLPATHNFLDRHHGWALVMIIDPLLSVGRLVEEARSAYGLTAAEADICAGLMHGESLADIAARRHSALLTIRKQVNSCLAKTLTHHQTELVAKLSHILRKSG